MTLDTYFEIHVKKQDRWIIQSQYSFSDEKIAIETAKKLDKNEKINAVKLLMEVRDGVKGSYKSHLIYKSPGVTATKDQIDSTTTAVENIENKNESINNKGEAQGSEISDKPPFLTNPADTAYGSPTRLLVKILLILIISLFLGCLAAFITIEFVAETTIFGDNISGGQATNIVIGAFAVIFLASISLLSFAYIKRKDFIFRSSRRAKTKLYSNNSQPAHRKSSNSQKKTRATEEIANAMAGSENFILPNQTPKPIDTAEEHKSMDSSSVAKIVPDTNDTLSPNAEKQKVYLTEFLENFLSKFSHKQNKLDSFKIFGINLFLAGACQKLSDKGELDHGSRIAILMDCLQSLGLKKSHAAAFVEKSEGYLIQDPHYMKMYQAGLNAMGPPDHKLEDAVTCLEEAVKEWDQSERALEEKKPITLLLTKISIPETILGPNQSRSQEYLKAHNDIVRKALAEKNGFEISLFKNGIVASFDRVSDSIDAAIEIQHGALIHRQASPNLPLHIKIAINTGEPFIDERDSFDSMAQTCESISTKAENNEIFVSDIVRGACKGRGYRFSTQGSHQIIGFQGSINLYEVLWQTETI